MAEYGQAVLVTDAAAEPVTTAEAKDYLRVSGSDDDTIIGNLIIAARQALEAYLSRAFIDQTWDVAYDAIPDDEKFLLPRTPASSITSITGYHEDGTTTAVTTGDMTLDTYHQPSLLVPTITGYSWPTSLRPTAGLVVRYVAGYGSSASDVPQAIQDAIVEQVRAVYDGETTGGRISERAKTLVRGYRIRSV